ncbi:DegT/DnrJ/EryC1/StrS family aminotransferase [Citricoccus sp. I39-566]|uniref:DegT/DnrJ/EryC1/StrS family aminotransferase n=1 Tax=Citricoccus TaxID=169133 RepID=UPI00286C0267|nr:DegT/DnrJ/EryC1/StrS family aminotransferase [Citricoccus sp. I39-566]WMY79672.1 DegT/DnrJ/EryC1/StrS family aminotransferase [Citricoccus sp. I39-566]
MTLSRITDVPVEATSIPAVDLGAQQREIDEEVQAGLRRVFDTTAFMDGPDVKSFEREFAAFIEVSDCVGVGNGTDALELALRAAGVTAGGEVILPANTVPSTTEAVSRIGAAPVLVDVDPRYLLIDPEAVAAAVNGRTQAIVPVHLHGQTAFVEQLRPEAERVGAVIVEDASQAQGAFRHGRMAGSLGLASGTGFSPGRNLGAAGNAGAVLTDDAGLAARVRSEHVGPQQDRHRTVGMDSRLDSVQAVVLRAKLSRLERWNGLRRAAADRYTELLRPLAALGAVWLPSEAQGNYHVWQLYTVQVEDRDRVLAELQEAGIGAVAHYPDPMHPAGAVHQLGLRHGAFPIAEAAADRLLSLPIFPHITEEQQERVVDVLVRSLLTVRQ